MIGWVCLLLASTGLLWLMLTAPGALDRRRARLRARLPCRCCREGWPVVWINLNDDSEYADALRLCDRHRSRLLRISGLEEALLYDEVPADSLCMSRNGVHRWKPHGKSHRCTRCQARLWAPSAALLPPAEHEHQWPERGRGTGGRCTVCGLRSWEVL